MTYAFPQLGPIIRGRFVERPNRFLVRCATQELGTIEAFMPNPGRLRELLFPDVPVYLIHTPGEKRKTAYTAVAVERDGDAVFLHTHLNNQVAAYLLASGMIPTLEKVEIVRAEAPHGRSRFDFLVRESGHEFFLEVKSVTLFGRDIAMFPDAITDRGRRHLIELAELGRKGPKPVVLFIVHSSRVSQFMPDYHTDLAFSETFLEVRDDLRILAVSIGWTKNLALRKPIRLLEIPWKHLEAEVVDSGSFVAIARYEGTHLIVVGDVAKGLARRMRQMKSIPRTVPHVPDCLHGKRASWDFLAVRGRRAVACAFARRLAEIYAPLNPSTSLDCDCRAHSFYSSEDPQRQRAFHDILEGFRMIS